MTVCRTGGPGPNGISILLVPRQDAIKIRPLETTGGNISGISFVSFENAICPVENVLGELNKGFKALLTNFNYEYVSSGVVLRIATKQANGLSFCWQTMDNLRDVSKKRARVFPGCLALCAQAKDVWQETDRPRDPQGQVCP